MNSNDEMFVLTKQHHLDIIIERIENNEFDEKIDVELLIEIILSGKLLKVTSFFEKISDKLFFDFLYKVDPYSLKMFSTEYATIGLQDKLMAFLDILEDLLEMLTLKLLLLEAEIEEIDPKSKMSNQKINTKFSKKINKFKNEINAILIRINNGLLLVWKTNNNDLIRMCCYQKTCWEKYSKFIIGHKKKGRQSVSGLYARLEYKLNRNPDTSLS